MEVLERTRVALLDLFERFKDRGVLAVYIWGSILTDDFDPAHSDIDTMAIVKDGFSSHDIVELKSLARTSYDLPSLSIQALYVSELNGGQIKSGVASVIAPKLLLSDLPNWLLVSGRRFTLGDFTLTVPTDDEAVELRLSRIKNEGWETVAAIPEHRHKYFLKLIARIIDLLQRKRGLRDRFSYTKIQNNAEGMERKLTAAIIASRKSGWDFSIFLKNDDLFQTFLGSFGVKPAPRRTA